MFIVIEGLDGSGKSTVAKCLADKLNATLLSTPEDDFKNIRKQLDLIFKKDLQARQLFYMATVRNISERVKELKKFGSSIVVDRYWLSTQVYHCWMSKGLHYGLSEVENELMKPNLTVFLDLTLEERTKRIGLRNNNTIQDSETLSQESDDKLRELYDSMRHSKPVGEWLQADGSLEVNSIVDLIINKISLLAKSQQ